jgi:hypothetical protein
MSSKVFGCPCFSSKKTEKSSVTLEKNGNFSGRERRRKKREEKSAGP